MNQFIVLPFRTAQQFHDFFAEHKLLFAKLVLRKIEIAIQNMDELALLFYYGDTHTCVFIRRSGFETVIEHMKNILLKIEAYELIPRCTSLLDQHQINNELEKL